MTSIITTSRLSICSISSRKYYQHALSNRALYPQYRSKSNHTGSSNAYGTKTSFTLPSLIMMGIVTTSTAFLTLSSKPSTLLEERKAGEAKIMFLGSGSSTGCPKPNCIFDKKVNNINSEMVEYLEQQRQKCKVSSLAIQGNPKFNKNYRNNPSIIISHYNADDSTECKTSSEPRNVIIDVGKTFRETALRWLPGSGIQSLDAVVLTHEHMDAMGGMDDLRGFQSSHVLNPKSSYSYQSNVSTPIYLSPSCFEAIKKSFHYLVPKDTKISESSQKVIRHVAKLTYNLIHPYTPFVAAGLEIVPLPVIHGEDMICLGFFFSLRSPRSEKSTNVAYLSDISRILPETQRYLSDKEIDILVIDSLLWRRSHSTHISLEQALELAKTLKAKNTYVVGINCDDFLEHDEMNEYLSKNMSDINIQLAHDGLVLQM